MMQEKNITLESADIQNLADEIILELINSISDADHTITHGKPGILIALSYYSCFHLNPAYKKKVDNAIQKCINGILNDIETKHLDSSLAFGLGGITYALQTAYQLNQKDKIDPDWFDDLNTLLAESTARFLEIFDFDFFRGASGLITYILKFYPEKELLSKFVTTLYEKAVWDGDGCYWIFYSFDPVNKTFTYREELVNLGLAHGISGIISVLSELYKKGIAQNECYKMIEGAINYLRKIQSNEHLSQFPPIFNLNSTSQEESRLGWCYGDSALGLCILKAAKYCKNESWYTFGEEICRKSAERKINESLLEEHGICHGYFGTMHIYNKLFENTGKSVYKEAKEYWFDTGIAERDFNLNSLGFYQTDYNAEYKPEKRVTYGLLQGLSGILLCLLSYNGTQYPWDDLLLMSIEE
ncbi:lantibiotic modifying enzyme [Flavobacterium sp. 2755]|uniref:lanthionine synthetase C family protein n=1 Tax=Flavobacterium sp. 2755 TaxID=2817765 RepID=UPI002855D828|nr:lanthionine synthetase C family protein [Flavobacterium sp. 2755]MDR6761953.1 lantibiotic modifying enzyme [Flavobacterium sp. 2755]